MWHDTRTMELVNNIIDKLGSKDYFRKKTGLPINTYFSASKFKWMMENVDEIREKFLNNDVDDLCFGTIDSWVNFVKNIFIYFKKITGNFYTDVTNASRTNLMNLDTLDWDEEILNFYQIPRQCLPKILSSSDNFGRVLFGQLNGIPITGY